MFNILRPKKVKHSLPTSKMSSSKREEIESKMYQQILLFTGMHNKLALKCVKMCIKSQEFGTKGPLNQDQLICLKNCNKKIEEFKEITKEYCTDEELEFSKRYANIQNRIIFGQQKK